ncbi:hypothetical protein LguiA_008478 [Lonicera macranthoides]
MRIVEAWESQNFTERGIVAISWQALSILMAYGMNIDLLRVRMLLYYGLPMVKGMGIGKCLLDTLRLSQALPFHLAQTSSNQVEGQICAGLLLHVNRLSVRIPDSSAANLLHNLLLCHNQSAANSLQLKWSKLAAFVTAEVQQIAAFTAVGVRTININFLQFKTEENGLVVFPLRYVD